MEKGATEVTPMSTMSTRTQLQYELVGLVCQAIQTVQKINEEKEFIASLQYSPYGVNGWFAQNGVIRERYTGYKGDWDLTHKIDGMRALNDMLCRTYERGCCS